MWSGLNAVNYKTQCARKAQSKIAAGRLWHLNLRYHFFERKAAMFDTQFTIAMWCMVIAMFLPYTSATIAKAGGFGKKRSEGGFDNNNPREWLAKLTGHQARANAAQYNAFESLPFFYAAVIVAHYLQANQGYLDILCMVWISLRVLYLMLYIADQANMRSVIWFLALLVNIWIFFLGYR